VQRLLERARAAGRGRRFSSAWTPPTLRSCAGWKALTWCGCSPINQRRLSARHGPGRSPVWRHAWPTWSDSVERAQVWQTDSVAGKLSTRCGRAWWACWASVIGTVVSLLLFVSVGCAQPRADWGLFPSGRAAVTRLSRPARASRCTKRCCRCEISESETDQLVVLPDANLDRRNGRRSKRWVSADEGALVIAGRPACVAGVDRHAHPDGPAAPGGSPRPLR